MIFMKYNIQHQELTSKEIKSFNFENHKVPFGC